MPPLVGVAVNVTEVPGLEHIEVEDVAIETDGVSTGLTIILVLPAALVQPLVVIVTL